ncbi:MAG: DNA-directed RNA polymerase subunit L [Candidatus Aenigmatarchaeota archaeon]
MKIEVLENEKDKLKIEIHDNLTLVNLINENIWKQKGVDFSAYSQQHPYLSKPVLIVKGKDPKKIVIEAAEQIIEDVKEFRKHFQNVVK